jgi:hypothetical protein
LNTTIPAQRRKLSGDRRHLSPVGRESAPRTEIRTGAIGSLLAFGPLAGKEGSQQIAAFLGQNARGDRRPVI